ncbi:MAG: hypothetical protein QXS90_01190 [Candidatus Diapherotrites archaeon]
MSIVTNYVSGAPGVQSIYIIGAYNAINDVFNTYEQQCIDILSYYPDAYIGHFDVEVFHNNQSVILSYTYNTTGYGTGSNIMYSTSVYDFTGVARYNMPFYSLGDAYKSIIVIIHQNGIVTSTYHIVAINQDTGVITLPFDIFFWGGGIQAGLEADVGVVRTAERRTSFLVNSVTANNTASTVLLPYNNQRNFLLIQNQNNSSSVYVSFNGSITTSVNPPNAIKLRPNEYIMYDKTVPINQIHVRTQSGTALVVAVFSNFHMNKF